MEATSAPSVESPKVPLLDVLHDLGSQLTTSDVPNVAYLNQVVGAVVKVLEHAGVTVPDELYPPAPATVARPATADDTVRTNQRLDRLETLLGKIADHVGASETQPASGPDTVENTLA